MFQTTVHQLSKGVAFIGKPVHATLFPYPIAPTHHAARISMAYQVNARAATAATNTKLSWPTYIAGYLIMTWGGTIITHNLLQLPVPMLYSITPYIIYITTHLTLTLMFRIFPFFISPTSLAFFDTVLFPLDALVRTSAVTNTTAHLVSGSSVSHTLVTSPLTHLIIGALASSGGGLSASTLSTWSTNWSFGTPPILRAPTLTAFFWASMDVWGGALVAVIHGVVSGHEAFFEVQAILHLVIQSVVDIKASEFPVGRPWMSQLEAKALAAGVLAVCFGLRAYRTHWAGATPSQVNAKLTKTKAQ